MAEFRINVVVDPSNAVRGTRRVNSELQRVSTTADALRNTLNRAFLFRGIDAGIRRLNELRNTLNLNGRSIRRLGTNTDDLVNSLASANLDPITQAINQLTESTRLLNTSQRRAIQSTRRFNTTAEAVGGGAAVARTEVNQLRRSTSQLNNEFNRINTTGTNLRNTLSNIFAFVGVGVSIRELVRFTDTFTDLQNRLRTVTADITQLNVVTDELFEISQRTRSSFEASAELFTRVGLATRELGLSQRETLNFTESLNQAITLSGASAIEAQAGLIQLSQGLAAGRLNGDELRSVLEQLPAVADVIAERLGVTRGELRTLGAQGRITAQEVIAAFTDAREELGTRFAQTVPTLSQAFTVLRNSIIRTIGDLDQASGTTAILAQGVIALANNMDTLLRIVGAVSGAIAINFTRNAIGGAITGVRTLTAAIALNPFGAIAIGVAAAVSALISFRNEITLTEDGLVTLEDTAIAAFQVIGESIGPIIDSFLTEFNEAIASVVQSFSDLGITFDDVLGLARTFVNRQIGLFVGLGNVIGTIFTEIGRGIDAVIGSEFIRTLSDLWTGFINLVIEIFNDFILIAREALDIIGIAVDEISTLAGIEVDFEAPRIFDTFDRIGNDAREAFLEGYNRDFVGELEGIVTPAIDRIADRAREISNRRIEQERARQEREAAARAALSNRPDTGPARPAADFTAILNQLQQQARLLQLNNQEREVQAGLLRIEQQLRRQLTDVEREQAAIALENANALGLQAEILQGLRGPQEEYIRTLEAANQLLEEGRINLDQFNTVLNQTEFSQAITGLQDSLLGQESGLTRDIENQLSERQDLIQQALDARVISEQEANQLIVESQRQASNEIRDLETARFRTQLQAGQTTFNSLASIARDFVGEQSSVYRNLFALSKGFAVADSAVQIANALAKAANTPFPANLAAIATVAAQTANIVSTIQGTQFAGAFQNGGEFMVGGSGGTDSQLVSFAATPGERVTVETPQQRRSAENQQQGSGQTSGNNIRIVNVVDPSMVEEFLTSSSGEQVLVNSIQRNASSINSILQGS